MANKVELVSASLVRRKAVSGLIPHKCRDLSTRIEGRKKKVVPLPSFEPVPKC